MLQTHAATNTELVEGLRERIRYLEDALKPVEFCLPVGIYFTTCERTLATRLLLRPNIVVTKDQLYRALYLDRDEVELKIVDVFICKLRKKLKALDIKIDTTWGRGYSLNPESYVKLKALIAPAANA